MSRGRRLVLTAVEAGDRQALVLPSDATAAPVVRILLSRPGGFEAYFSQPLIVRRGATIRVRVGDPLADTMTVVR